MNPPDQTPRIGFTPGEIRAFRYHAVIVAAIAAGLAVVARSGAGKVLGVVLALILLPLPPLVVYLLRRRRARKTAATH